MRKKRISLQSLISSDREMTTSIAGREVTVAQKPFIEKDIAAARKVLDRLQRLQSSAKVISTARVVKEIEV